MKPLAEPYLTQRHTGRKAESATEGRQRAAAAAANWRPVSTVMWLTRGWSESKVIVRGAHATQFIANDWAHECEIRSSQAKHTDRDAAELGR